MNQTVVSCCRKNASKNGWFNKLAKQTKASGPSIFNSRTAAM